jgi:membrane fusion protein, multidrug efflux system
MASRLMESRNTEEELPPQGASGGRRRLRIWLFATVGVAVAVILVGMQFRSPAESETEAHVPAAVPVTIIKVGRSDVPIFANGIGTVQPYRTVVVKARLTGTIDKIAFTEGQEVKPNDLLATIDPRPYAAAFAQAQAKQAADQALATNDEVNLKRDSSLAANSYASKQQVDNDMATMRQLQANVAADKAAVDTAALNLSFCNITSPISGVVGFQQVNAGNLVQTGDSQGIVTINQVHPISVVFTLPEDTLPAVQAAMARGKARVLVLAFADDNVTQISAGTLLTPSNTINISTGTIALKAVFPNLDDRLWPGQFVNAHLELSVQPNAITVPIQAIQHGPNGLYVYVVKSDDKVANQPITVGYQNDKIAVVATGLNGDESVVLNGQSRLQNGTMVAAKSS